MSKSSLRSPKPFQHFVQQGVQRLGFGVGEVHAAGHGLADARGFALERFAFGGEAYGKLPKVNSFKKKFLKGRFLQKKPPEVFPGRLFNKE